MSELFWINRKVVGVGEAMVEFAPIGDNLYRRGFAGDTLNTCWHIAKLLRDHGSVDYFTRVGEDASSSEFLDFLANSGLGAATVTRDSRQSIGLYVISLSGAERSFSYWRDSSAARGLANDFDALLGAVTGAGLIHISGITLAVIGEEGRQALFRALGAARANGSLVSYDPNVRPRLWRDVAEMRRALHAILEVADIALPSFDDEARLWGDATPEATAKRMHKLGVQEIAVKNGADAIVLLSDGALAHVPTPAIGDVRDTTGAGDSFNAGYLAARLVGMGAAQACGLGQRLAGEVIRHFGALAPEASLEPFHREISRRASEG